MPMPSPALVSTNDLVAVMHKLDNAGRRHADAELERLDLFGYSDLSLALSLPLVVFFLSTDDSAEIAAFACNIADKSP